MIRIATYNVHKCRGIDRRVSVERICEVVASLNADVVALQEIFHDEHVASHEQVRHIASALGYEWSFGENRLHAGAAYGNATLSRLPITMTRNYDITWRGRERRGCLRTDIALPSGERLHVFNVHLGTSFFERPHQARMLLTDDLLKSRELDAPRVVVGDFNEWTRGVATRLMSAEFDSVDAKLMRRSFPGMLPVFRLDHFYFDKHLQLSKFRCVRNRLTLVASDHLPLVADFRVVTERAA